MFTSIDGSTAILQTNSTKQVVVSNEQGEQGVSHQGGFIAVGKGVIRANGSIPSISVLSSKLKKFLSLLLCFSVLLDRMCLSFCLFISLSLDTELCSERPCSSYCPYNSICVNGYCECSKGFGGNVHLGCEDINECLVGSPCGEETVDNWCANTEGSFTCCTRNSTEENCWGESRA